MIKPTWWKSSAEGPGLEGRLWYVNICRLLWRFWFRVAFADHAYGTNEGAIDFFKFWSLEGNLPVSRETSTSKKGTIWIGMMFLWHVSFLLLLEGPKWLIFWYFQHLPGLCPVILPKSNLASCNIHQVAEGYDSLQGLSKMSSSYGMFPSISYKFQRLWRPSTKSCASCAVLANRFRSTQPPQWWNGCWFLVRLAGAELAFFNVLFAWWYNLGVSPKT